MNSKARTFIAPAFLLACLLLGGSAQGIWFNMALQLAGIALIAWAAFAHDDEPLSPAARQLLILLAITLAVIALQLVPLPPQVWTHLPGRAALAKGFAVMAMPVPWEPLSLNPAASLDSMLGIIPPLAMFAAMVRLRAYRQQTLSVALVAGTVLGIGLVALQVASSNGELTRWYLYPSTNPGRGVGFFANLNHMGTLLVITIPFLAASVTAARTLSKQRYLAVAAIASGVALLVLVGIALNGSLAAYGLAVPVAAASVLMLLPPRSRLRLWVLGIAALLAAVCIGALYFAPIDAGGVGTHADISVGSRSEILHTTLNSARQYMPFGSGLGTFRDVYPLSESPTDVSAMFVIHAHDDYAELLLELGVAGVLLVLLFLAWWGTVAWRVWRTAESKPFARAAAIASAAILLHSLVDFPLRTAAISTCFAMCLALLADGRGAAPGEKKRLRRSRHAEFR